MQAPRIFAVIDIDETRRLSDESIRGVAELCKRGWVGRANDAFGVQDDDRIRKGLIERLEDKFLVERRHAHLPGHSAAYQQKKGPAKTRACNLWKRKGRISSRVRRRRHAPQALPDRQVSAQPIRHSHRQTSGWGC
ncbi:hypothetical protein D9M72_623250 [compost metagenome]